MYKEIVSTASMIAIIITLFITLIAPVIVWIIYGVKNKGKGVWKALALGAAGFWGAGEPQKSLFMRERLFSASVRITSICCRMISSLLLAIGSDPFVNRVGGFRKRFDRCRCCFRWE